MQNSSMLYRKTGLCRTSLVEGPEEFIFNIYTQTDACAVIKPALDALGCMADSAVVWQTTCFFFS